MRALSLITACPTAMGLLPADSRATGPQDAGRATVFGYPRNFLNNRFIYLTVSPRARGLSVGINVNPDKLCNFDCAYCEVDRRPPLSQQALEVDAMAAELERTLAFICSGEIRQHPVYRTLPNELLELRNVALSGDGEPTLSPNFADVVQSVVHVRARGKFPFFKMVLVTNASALDLPGAAQGLELFAGSDEVWAKLDAGTQAFMEKINRPQVSLEKVLANILALARRRPVVIQSMFALLDGQEPPAEEIDQYIERLKELKAGGAVIPLVQVYSPTRPVALARCEHLSLKSLSRIAKLIHAATGLKAEVF